MDERAFAALVQRMTQRRLARLTAVRGMAASALVGIIALPDESDAKDRRKRDTRARAKHRGNGQQQAKAAGHAQVRAASRKKPFCLCRGTSATQCTPTTCMDCTYQGELGKRARKRIRKPFPFSFVVEDASACPVPTTTTTTTSAPTTTTTPRPTTTPPPPPPVTTTTTTTTSPPITTRVVVTVDPLEEGFCGVTLTLVEGVSGMPVSVFVDISNGTQFRPLFEPPTRIQVTGLLAEGQSLVAARAEQLDGDYQPTGVSVPVEFPTTPCSG